MEDKYEWLIKAIKQVEANGFGEVRVIIHNGTIHRILITEDNLIVGDHTLG